MARMNDFITSLSVLFLVSLSRDHFHRIFIRRFCSVSRNNKPSHLCRSQQHSRFLRSLIRSREPQASCSSPECIIPRLLRNEINRRGACQVDQCNLVISSVFLDQRVLADVFTGFMLKYVSHKDWSLCDPIMVSQFKLSGLTLDICWTKSIAICWISFCLLVSPERADAASPKGPVLTPPSNAFISYTPSDLVERTVAKYTCLPGYEAFGEVRRICRQGVWTGEAPVCAINIAIRQNAKQGTNATEFTASQGVRQAYEAAAYLAVDGTKIYCSRTTFESNPTWVLTLTKDYPVIAVKIYGDFLPEINDIEVSLLAASSVSSRNLQSDLVPNNVVKEREKSDDVASSCSLSSITAAPLTTDQEGDPVKQNVMLFVCRGNATARQVLITRRTYTSLRLCEVEVFSQEGVPCQHPGSPSNGIVKLSQVDWPFPPGAVAVYDCNAGYTRIPMDAAYHRTCQINGSWDMQEPVCVVNVAQHKPTTISSLFSQYNYPSWQAVDSDTNSCTWTSQNSNQNETKWFQVDLMKIYSIHAVSIVLERDRLFYQFHRSIMVTVSDRPDDYISRGSVPAIFRKNLKAAAGSGIYYLDAPVDGRYVTVHLQDGERKKYLGICDLQVLASDELPATPNQCGLQTPPTAFLYSFKRTCYQVQRFTATNWYNAMLSCQDNGGQLVVNPDYDTTVFLTNILSNLYRFHTSDDRYWIAAKLNKDSNQWTFAVRNTTVPVESTYWAAGRPLNTGFADYDSCVALGGHGVPSWSWADYRCDQDPANWICAYGPRGCGDPAQPEGSALLVADKLVGVAGWKTGDHVQYECAPGYLLTGSVETVCQSDGTWSGQPAACQFVACGDPPKRSHLNHILLNGTTYYNSFVQYFCSDDDSKLVGKSLIQCLSTGSWEVLSVMCETAFANTIPAAVPVDVRAGSPVKADDAALLGNAHLLEPTVVDSSASVNDHTSNPEAVGIGIGVAVSAAVFIVLFIYCGIYRRRKLAMHAATPVKKRSSPYSTIRRLHASQISGPIAILQTTETPKILSVPSEYDATPQASVSSSDDAQSVPDGSYSPTASVPSESNTNYLKSFGKAGIVKLYQKAKLNGTLRGLSFSDDAPTKERPRVPRLVISSPIECRKTVVLDSGTEYARAGTEVIYAQPGKMSGLRGEKGENRVLRGDMGDNQYEYLETARVHGGYGNPMDGDDGVYADTSLSGSSQQYLTRASNDEVYDDVRMQVPLSDNGRLGGFGKR